MSYNPLVNLLAVAAALGIFNPHRQRASQVRRESSGTKPEPTKTPPQERPNLLFRLKTDWEARRKSGFYAGIHKRPMPIISRIATPNYTAVNPAHDWIKFMFRESQPTIQKILDNYGEERITAYSSNVRSKKPKNTISFRLLPSSAFKGFLGMKPQTVFVEYRLADLLQLLFEKLNKQDQKIGPSLLHSTKGDFEYILSRLSNDSNKQGIYSISLEVPLRVTQALEGYPIPHNFTIKKLMECFQKVAKSY